LEVSRVRRSFFAEAKIEESLGTAIAIEHGLNGRSFFVCGG